MTVQTLGTPLHLVGLCTLSRDHRRSLQHKYVVWGGGQLHFTHESYSQKGQPEYNAVECLSSTIGKGAVGALMSTFGTDGQHAILVKFIQNELDTEREKIPCSPSRFSTYRAAEKTECLTARTVETAAGWCYRVDTHTSTRITEDWHLQVHGS